MNQHDAETIKKEVFTRKNMLIILLILVVLGIFLRSIVGNNASPSPDAINFGLHAIDFLNNGATSNQNQSPLWFALADIFYRIFGVTLFSASLTSIIFSALTILVVFLLANELFNKKIALIAAFLFTVSAFSLKMILMEMDATFTFFYLLSVYLFISKLFKKNKISLLSAVVFGLGVLSKPISLTLAPGFILVYLLYFIKNKDKRKLLINSDNIKRAVLSILIVILLFMPVLIYNYLLFKEKGLTDVMFARFFGTSMDFYASIAHTMQPFSINSLVTKGFSTSLSFFYARDPLIFLLAILGTGISIIKKNFKSLVLILVFVPTYLFLSGTSLLDNHFVVFAPLFSILAAMPLFYLFKKIKKKYIIIPILLLILIFNLYVVKDVLESQSAVGKLRDFAIDNIDDSSLVLTDNRIYGGRTAWMFNDKHYLEVSNLNLVLTELSKSPSQPLPIKTFFVECAADDCGWGTIKAGPLNDSMESLIPSFSENAINVHNFGPGGGDQPSNVETYFRVYEGNMIAKPEILDLADQTHIWFFYPVRWKLKDRIYDSYTTEGFIDKTLDFIAHLVLYISVILAFLSIIYTIYLVSKLNDAEEGNAGKDSLL